MYQIWCPPDVKAHGSAWDYIDKQGPTLEAAQIRRITDDILADLLRDEVSWYGLEPRLLLNLRDQDARKADLRLREKSGKGIKEDAWHKLQPRLKTYFEVSEDKNSILRAYFVPQKDRHPIIRRIVSSAYSIGTALLFIPAADVFWRVAASFGEYLLSGFIQASPG